MVDVRAELGVDSVRWKVERRCLEKIGPVFRMDNGRMTKQVVLGWMSELKKWERKPGTNWRKLLREAEMDIFAIGELTADRRIWKIKVKERMMHLREYEKSKGHKWTGGEMARNAIREEVVVFDCSVCGKICKSKAGLPIHKKRMHEVSSLKKTCEKWDESFKQEANLRNHEKVCTGVASVEKSKGFPGPGSAKPRVLGYPALPGTGRVPTPLQPAIPFFSGNLRKYSFFLFLVFFFS